MPAPENSPAVLTGASEDPSAQRRREPQLRGASIPFARDLTDSDNELAMTKALCLGIPSISGFGSIVKFADSMCIRQKANKMHSQLLA